MDEKTPDSGMKRPGGKPPGGTPPGRAPPPSPSLHEEHAGLLHQFVREHGRPLLTMAIRMVGRTYAEDVAQEAFVRLAEQIERRPLPEVMALLRSPTDLRKLMCRITACRAYEHLRRRESLTRASHDDRVERAYASLSAMQRIALVLHDYYGFTDTDFQLTLGISKTSSRALVSRANRALRRALEEKS